MTSETAWFIASCILGGLILLSGAFLWGYEIGVRETEERWSDAVGRAENARAQAQEPKR